MSRSGYSDDCEHWDLIRWRGAVASALRGARGQAFLSEMLVAMDALPEKKLIKDSLAVNDGGVCAMGAVGKARGIDMTGIESYDREQVAGVFKIAPALAAEIAFENDEGVYREETPEQRFARMRAWIVSNIKPRRLK